MTDRLTMVLVGVALFLTAIVTALCVDLWLWPERESPVVQASAPQESTQVAALFPVEPSPGLSPTLSPSPLPSTETPLPTASPTPFVEPSPTAPVTPPACVPPDDWGIHVVQDGNTLRSIARRYGVSVDALMYVNCLNTDTIFINQRIYVPGLATTPEAQMAASGGSPIAVATPQPGSAATPGLGAQPTPTAISSFRIEIPDHYINILLLGSDKRPNAGTWRTDSMIVVSVDTVNNMVRMLSIPRDLWVNIPGHGFNRINTADLWGELAKKGGGPDRVKQTIHQNLGIPIHYYVRVDFQGFMDIIDMVGGVTIDVDCPLPDIKLEAGVHHMDGKQALRYARSRKSTNDFDRARRQQKVLVALWEQALTMDLIPKLPELWRTTSGAFQTDLPLSQVINLAYVGVQLRPQQIMNKSIGASHVQSWVTPQGAMVLLPRQDKIKQLLDAYYAPVQPEQVATVDRVRVRVLNGTQRKEIEALAAAALKRSGVQIVGTGKAERQDYGQTQIQVLRGSIEAAQKVASDLSVPASAIQDLTTSGAQPDPANPVDILVILGRDYNPCKR
jgi:LCP family protein required for cell wall assembly